VVSGERSMCAEHPVLMKCQLCGEEATRILLHKEGETRLCETHFNQAWIVRKENLAQYLKNEIKLPK
jgi:hypothetical protein